MTFSIRLKLITFTFCIILLVGGSIFLYSIYQGRQRLFAAFEKESLETTAVIADTIVNHLYFLDVRSLRLRLESARVNPDIRYAYVTGVDGVVLTGGSGDNPLRDQRLTDGFSEAMLRSASWLSRLDGGLLKVGGPVYLPDGSRVGYLQVGFSLDSLDQTVRDGTRASLYITLVCLGMGGLLAFALSTRFTRPVLSIVRASREIGSGKLDTRLPVTRADELGVLAASTNRMAEALQRRQAETERNLAGIRALHEIDIAISSTLDLQNVLKILLEKIDLFLPYSSATVRLVNRETGQLEPVAARNLDEAEWKLEPWKAGRGPANVVFETKAPMMIRNCPNDPRVRDPEFFRRHGLISYLGVPMFAKDELLGVLSFYTKEEHAFSNEEVAFLVTLAGQAAIAINNSAVYEELAKLAGDLQKANRVKDEFLSVMSHELRTPMSVVMGYTAMIRDRLLGQINPEQEQALEKVIDRARDQLAMINSILQATQLDAEQVKVESSEVPLKEFLDDLKSNYAIPLGKDLNFVWDYAPDLPAIRTDTVKLQHVLHNLIDNAVKFTESGTVTVSVRTLGEAGVGGASNGDPDGASQSGLVRFTVTDTGIGIAKDQLPMIFERFRQVDSSETRRYGGVGIGLYIVKKFTELIGGRIEVESQPGKGSSFVVTVPRDISKTDIVASH